MNCKFTLKIFSYSLLLLSLAQWVFAEPQTRSRGNNNNGNARNHSDSHQRINEHGNNNHAPSDKPNHQPTREPNRERSNREPQREHQQKEPQRQPKQPTREQPRQPESPRQQNNNRDSNNTPHRPDNRPHEQPQNPTHQNRGDSRPNNQPNNQPNSRPNNRPEREPNRPNNRPNNQPNNRPAPQQNPNNNRPHTQPTPERNKQFRQNPNGSRSYFRRNLPVYTQTERQRNNRTYIERTYVRNNVQTVRTYNPHLWGSRVYYSYLPARHYDPHFYHYCSSVWYQPVYYTWVWSNDPWYRHYNYYFTPYRLYSAPSYWLTDFIIADILSVQYVYWQGQSNVEINVQLQNNNPTMISQSMKEQIRSQVDDAIREHELERTVPMESILRDTRHIFALNDEYTVFDENTYQTCSLSDGDLVRLESPVTDSRDTAAQVLVLTSKQGSCPAGSRVWLSIDTLIESENGFNERLDDGIEKLKTEFHQ